MAGHELGSWQFFSTLDEAGKFYKRSASDYSAFLELSTKIFPLEQLFRDIQTLKPKGSENLADPEKGR